MAFFSKISCRRFVFVSGFSIFMLLLLSSKAFSHTRIARFECKNISIIRCISQFEVATGYSLTVAVSLNDQDIDLDLADRSSVSVVEAMFRSAGFKNVGIVVDEEKRTMSVTPFDFDGKVDKITELGLANGLVQGDSPRPEKVLFEKKTDNSPERCKEVGENAKIDLDGYVKMPSGQIITFREMESIQQKAALQLNLNEIVIRTGHDNKSGITFRHIVETSQRANELIQK